jgi:hypothetical protein
MILSKETRLPAPARDDSIKLLSRSQNEQSANVMIHVVNVQQMQHCQKTLMHRYLSQQCWSAKLI